MPFRPRILVLAGLAVVAMSGEGRADAIDGQWCAVDGKRIEINGPRIRTPGGAQMQGDYDRHGFRYVVPAAEPGGMVEVRLASGASLQARSVIVAPGARWRRSAPGTPWRKRR